MSRTPLGLDTEVDLIMIINSSSRSPSFTPNTISILGMSFEKGHKAGNSARILVSYIDPSRLIKKPSLLYPQAVVQQGKTTPYTVTSGDEILLQSLPIGKEYITGDNQERIAEEAQYLTGYKFYILYCGMLLS